MTLTASWWHNQESLNDLKQSVGLHTTLPSEDRPSHKCSPCIFHFDLQLINNVPELTVLTMDPRRPSGSGGRDDAPGSRTGGKLLIQRFGLYDTIAAEIRTSSIEFDSNSTTFLLSATMYSARHLGGIFTTKIWTSDGIDSSRSTSGSPRKWILTFSLSHLDLDDKTFPVHRIQAKALYRNRAYSCGDYATGRSSFEWGLDKPQR